MSDSNPLCQSEINRIVALYTEGAKYREIKVQIGRPTGTVKTALRQLRAAGVIQGRYSVAEWKNA